MRLTEPDLTVTMRYGKLAADKPDSAVDAMLAAWHARMAECIHTMKGHTDDVTSVAFLPDGAMVTGSWDGTTKLWDKRGVCTTMEHGGSVRCIAVSPDGSTIASGGDDRKIKLWRRGRLVKTLEGHTRDVRSVAFSPDGKTLVSGSDDKTVRSWDVATGVCRTMEGHSDLVLSVAISPDGKTIVSGSKDKTIKVWDAESGRLEQTLEGHTSYLATVAISPDGALLASGSWDSTIRLWDTRTWECVAVLRGHTHFVFSVAFSPDGRTLASGSGDNTIKFWSIDSGECFKTLRGHTDWANSVVFSPDGSTLLSGSKDNTAKQWPSIKSPEIEEVCAQPTLGADIRLPSDDSPLYLADLARVVIHILATGLPRSFKMRLAFPPATITLDKNRYFKTSADNSELTELIKSFNTHISQRMAEKILRELSAVVNTITADSAPESLRALVRRLDQYKSTANAAGDGPRSSAVRDPVLRRHLAVAAFAQDFLDLVDGGMSPKIAVTALKHSDGATPADYHDASELVQTAIDAFIAQPTSQHAERIPTSYTHAGLIRALAYTKEYMEDAEEELAEYLAAVPEPDPLAILVEARIRGSAPLTRFFCETFPQLAERFATADERSTDDNEAEPQPQPESEDDRIQQAWEQYGMASAAMDELLAMSGMRALKRECIDIAQQIRVRNDPRTAQLYAATPMQLNFILSGNPGTGKSTCAKLIHRFLADIGARDDTFTERNGGTLADTSPLDITKELDSLFPAGFRGTVFIDEAYQLNPAQKKSGKSVMDRILDVAETRRGDVTIILAGYKDDMKDLLATNPGLNSRFSRQFVLEDFDKDTLQEMFTQLATKQGWSLAPAVAEIAGRRLERFKSRDTFANGRTVRNMFSQAIEAAAKRLILGGEHMLLPEDILGPAPSADSNPELRRLLAELDGLTGLGEVKEAVRGLLQTAKVNYDNELHLRPLHAFALNRLFFGNPGTGKTTVARLYGQILKHTGLLSSGEVIEKRPSDLVGDAVGQSRSRTKAAIEEARGKVLLIDECYSLDDGVYGKEALDTIVERVHNKPGDDIAVLMLGYEEPIRRMLRNQNAGLASRFDPESAFIFADFDDTALEAILKHAIAESGLACRRAVVVNAIQLLAKERVKPNFGNARAVVNLVNKAKRHMIQRDPTSRKIAVADLTQADDGKDPFEPLDGLYKVNHIRQRLEDLVRIKQGMERNGKSAASMLVRNYVFSGSPGTGKTTIARCMAKILYRLGVLATDTCKEVVARDMMAGYVGQTPGRVKELMDEAVGGVFFVDEAYGLGEGMFGKEAIETMLSEMTSDKHKGKTVVVLAGYRADLDRMMDVNAGVRSRFTEPIDFPDWSAADCTSFIAGKLEGEHLKFGSNEQAALRSHIEAVVGRASWANARDANTIFEDLLRQQAIRAASVVEAEPSIAADDVDAAMVKCKRNHPESASLPHLVEEQPVALATDSEVQPRRETRQDVRVEQVEEVDETVDVVTRVERDEGVTDEIWEELELAKREEQRRREEEERRLREIEEQLKREKEEKARRELERRKREAESQCSLCKQIYLRKPTMAQYRYSASTESHSGLSVIDVSSLTTGYEIWLREVGNVKRPRSFPPRIHGKDPRASTSHMAAHLHVPDLRVVLGLPYP
ncbi:CbxX/CfqX [Carpediemonas membranifera]|uniref:CbxX/CfqX n=1 Tax=Carpediemonas membranifera TaxID=201153 RepID=A0A8J6B9F3_9EUKA|nr:CbxX/CfqX [Carpediemonas membranifera]|eukprot:KAG9396949.1 CbxX/CfqX [Carpediemonas membranifera]